MRALILEADPGVTEEWKWGGPVWSHDGIICTGESYTKVVKLTFAKGASVPDPSGLFNSSLEGKTRRALDIPEGGKVDARAFKALVKAAVARNGTPAKKAVRPATSSPAATRASRRRTATRRCRRTSPRCRTGRRDIGKRLDALIVKNVPDVRKAVKWNTPLYGIEGQGWFLSSTSSRATSR